MDTYFYEITQNNSGGSFDVDDKLCHRLFIEASSPHEAANKAEELGCYWDGCANNMDCSCCGDRWHKPTKHNKVEFPVKWAENNTFHTIEEYAQYLANKYGWTKPDCRIFYKDGTVKEIFFNK